MRDIYPKLRLLTSNKLFLVICVILLGAIIRLLPLAIEGVSLPFRSGGLFVEFSQQISAHNYRLPSHIPFYSDGGIPFAYPPFPFYVEAVLLDIFPLSEFVVANLLPPIIAIISLPFFYFLTREYELKFPAQFAALVAYATIPAAFLEQIESAGLAEAFGTLALILLAIFLLRAHKADTIRNHMLAGLFWAICVVQSPGSAYASTLMFFIFAFGRLVHGTERRSIIRVSVLLTTTGIIALVLSSPYWLTVIANHGIHVFTDSFGAQHGNLWKRLVGTLGSLTKFNISRGNFHFLWDVMIFSGVVWAFARHHYGLLAWFIVLFSIPREGVWMVSIPACILAGIGITEVFGPLVVRKYVGRLGQIVILGAFSLYVSFNSTLYINSFVSKYTRHSWSESIVAMQWVRDNVPVKDKLVVLSGGDVREWVPHVSRRTVLNVTQGMEWIPDKHKSISELNKVLDSCLDFECIHANIAEMIGYHNVYLYVDKEQFSNLMSASYGEKAAFEPIWENSKVIILRYIKALDI